VARETPNIFAISGDYSQEFAAQRKAAAGLKAITLGNLRQSNISRMRARRASPPMSSPPGTATPSG
jgi:hypothetical protein